MLDLPAMLRGGRTILLEGGISERLQHEFGLPFPEPIYHAAFIYQEESALLASLYRQYIDIARSAGLPIMLLTPTWKATAENIAGSSYAGRDVNGDAVRFMRGVVEASGYADRAVLGGSMCSRRDNYDGTAPFGGDEAIAFHAPQVEALLRAGVDYLYASGMPSLAETAALAALFSGTSLPYILSFVIRDSGGLLDGTPLDDAIRAIDGAVARAPLGYMLTCVHPDVFGAGMRRVAERSPETAARIMGIQANGSPEPPEVLEAATETRADEPEVFAAKMMDIRRDYALRVLGGCCGTNAGHMDAVARRLAAGGTKGQE